MKSDSDTQGPRFQEGRRRRKPSEGNGSLHPKKNERWDQIVDAAESVFYEYGFDRSKVSEVAERVGLLAGSLYNYISTKEDLLTAVVQRFHSGADAVMEQSERIGRTPNEKIRAFAEGHLRYTMANIVPATVLQEEFKRLPEEPRARAAIARDRSEESLRRWIREGQEQGLIRRSIDPKLASLAIFGMLNSVYRWYRPDGEASANTIAEQLADLAVGALS